MTETKINLNQETILGTDGWTSANESWSYASATTITIPAGGASRYAKGDKIKLTQTTVKYFYIITVADTLLTVTGGSDYTVANAAITANYYSHATSPVGFPNNFSLGTPTWTGSLVNFTNQPANNSCRFWIVSNVVHIKTLASTHATSGGTGQFYATFTSGYLPAVSDASGSALNLSAPAGGYSYTQAGNNDRVYMANSAGTTLATNSQYFEAYVCYVF